MKSGAIRDARDEYKAMCNSSKKIRKMLDNILSKVPAEGCFREQKRLKGMCRRYLHAIRRLVVYINIGRQWRYQMPHHTKAFLKLPKSLALGSCTQ